MVLILVTKPNVAGPLFIALASVQANIVSCAYDGEVIKRKTNEGSIFYFSQLYGS